MSEQHSGRSRHQTPPISFIINKTPRSRSISNDLQREPILQPARILERQLSVAVNLDVTTTIEKKSKVSQLIEQFEKSKATDNVHRRLPTSTYNIPALTSSNNSKI